MSKTNTKLSARWSATPSGNLIIEKTDDFCISYIKHGDGILDGTFLGSPIMGETALIDIKERFGLKYYILNGDWRREYEELFDKGFEACLELFNNNKDSESVWSDTGGYK